MALVITLILLSVTLVMAIAFLAISRREEQSVTTSSDALTARLAADAALANAQAQIIASVLATRNPYNTGLLVSTNFVNGYGFVTGVADPTNVNYGYYNGGGYPLTVPDFEQNVANQLYLPRAPVFVANPTNSSVPGEFRFYLDLNRNGQFEDTGLIRETNNQNQFTGSLLLETGDPQWVGMLERPDVTHGPNNKFVSRYAYIAVPADGSLDVNAIHNQALHGNLSTTINPPPSAGDAFFRNQGAGSWEINLAAFLADLNTNIWGQIIGTPANGNKTFYYYQYLPNQNQGVAFDDARALIAYRYNNDYNSLPFASAVLSVPASYALPSPVDLFPLGPAMNATAAPFYNNNNLNNNRWAGGDNTNRFFAEPSDLFDPNKINTSAFAANLTAAGNTNSTYDRYTLYRMLAQLGADSAPAQNQINLCYSNALALTNVYGMVTKVVYYANAQTNLVPWQPLQFFNIAADRLLRQYSTAWFQSDPTNYLITYYGFAPAWYVDGTGYGVTNVSGFGLTNQVPSFGITNIPVLMNGQFAYTPAVQRVLQLVANIYDATTNQASTFGRDYPSVFRPIFLTSLNAYGATNVTIVGYEYVSGTTTPYNFNNHLFDSPIDINIMPGFLPLPYFRPDLKKFPNVADQVYANVYGVPWIIGAKKGFPNFNNFSMQNIVQVTRKLQVTRPTTNSLPNLTNQLYVLTLTNSLGVEFWNSYTNGLTNSSQNLQLIVNDQFSVQMQASNPVTHALISPLLSDYHLIGYNFPNGATVMNLTAWPGNSFMVPFATNFPAITNGIYQFGQPGFLSNPNPLYEQMQPTFAPFPQLLLEITNQLQAIILDNNHIVDYVHFTGPGTIRNVTAEFQNTNFVSGGNTLDYYTNLIWSTAPNNSGLPLGISTQIGISDGSIPLNTVFWKDPNANQEIDGFLHFLNPAYQSKYGSKVFYSTNLAVQVPYTPSVTTYEYTTYQANDPLVHYLRSDMQYFGYDPDNNSLLQTGVHQWPVNTAVTLLPGLGKVNARYQPWGRNPPGGQAGVSQANYDQSPYNLAFKDPLVTQPDNWDFPTYKLPTVGWLGRVHRGTPWQTVYMKSFDILAEANPQNPNLGNVGTNTWALWTSNPNRYDAVNAAPVQDRLLFDNFSTALNDNATRGQLSVNQTHLAAWSAVLSGVVALTNTTAFPKFKQFQPLTNTALIVQPAGGFGTNSVMGQMVNGINAARQKFKNNDGLTGVFEHVGDILSSPFLTEQSPFLNLNNSVQGGQQLQYGISDEVYEWLPQQTMSLLRVPGTSQSPLRYVIYSYGQTLKPAPGGVVTGGPNLADGSSAFGMVTNYQVVAETATRAVVQLTPVITTNFNGTLNTNYSSRVEQFNVLPPD